MRRAAGVVALTVLAAAVALRRRGRDRRSRRPLRPGSRRAGTAGLDVGLEAAGRRRAGDREPGSVRALAVAPAYPLPARRRVRRRRRARGPGVVSLSPRAAPSGGPAGFGPRCGWSPRSSFVSRTHRARRGRRGPSGRRVGPRRAAGGVARAGPTWRSGCCARMGIPARVVHGARGRRRRRPLAPLGRGVARPARLDRLRPRRGGGPGQRALPAAARAPARGRAWPACASSASTSAATSGCRCARGLRVLPVGGVTLRCLAPAGEPHDHGAAGRARRVAVGPAGRARGRVRRNAAGAVPARVARRGGAADRSATCELGEDPRRCAWSCAPARGGGIVKAILGRLSELGLRELIKLLTSAGAEGVLEVEGPAGPPASAFRNGHVAGEPSPAPLLTAFATRTGTFCFRPGARRRAPRSGFRRRSSSPASTPRRSTAKAGAPTHSGVTHGAGPAAPAIRWPSCATRSREIPIPGGGARVLIVAADPRPYRALSPEWRQRGLGGRPDRRAALARRAGAERLVIVHLPVTATLAGRARVGSPSSTRAASQRPPVPVLWVGGLADPVASSPGDPSPVRSSCSRPRSATWARPPAGSART